MKIYLIFIAAVIISSVLNAQENLAGKVVYEQVVKLDIKLEGDAAQFAHMLPKERKSKKILYFSPAATLYENDKAAAREDVSMNQGGANVMVRMAEPENRVFTSLADKRQVEQREFMTRMFLIEGEIKHTWKITGNQKIILDFPCQEAIMEEGDNKITAWFTPLIPVSGGPENYGGLPGLILSVETADHKQVTTAVSVDFEDIPGDNLQKPDKGKKVSREEFRQIVDEKMKEMGAEGQGGQHMMIRIQR